MPSGTLARLTAIARIVAVALIACLHIAACGHAVWYVFILLIPTTFVNYSLEICVHFCENFGVGDSGHNQLSLFDLLGEPPAQAGAAAHDAGDLLSQVLADNARGGGVF